MKGWFGVVWVFGECCGSGCSYLMDRWDFEVLDGMNWFVMGVVGEKGIWEDS